MAVNTTNSNLIANLENNPPIMNPVSKSGGRVRIMQDSFEVVAEDVTDDGDILRLCRLPTNAVLTSVLLASDALGAAAGTANVGFYYPDGTIIDEDIIATAITLLQAGGAFTDVLHEAQNINGCGTKVWQMAGLSADPGGHLDLCVTLAAAMTTPAAGTVSFKVSYTID